MRTAVWLLSAILGGTCLALPAPSSAQSVVHAAHRDVLRSRELTQRAIALLEKGEDTFREEVKIEAYSEGEKLAERAVELDERNAEAHYALFANRGRRLQTEGMGPNPMILFTLNRALDRCLELDPNHYNALVARGGMYRQLPRLLGGSLSKAVRYLERAVEVNPEAVAGRIELAEAYIDRGDLTSAEQALKLAEEWATRLGREDDLTNARLLLHDLDPRAVSAQPLCTGPLPQLTLARTF